MEIKEKITIGRLGQQPMHIADSSVDPQHATLTRIDNDTYIIEDNESQKGVFVFGIRVKRKTIKGTTPFFLGAFRTTVDQLLKDASAIDFDKMWNDYDKEKRKWDRYTTMVNSIRMLTPIITMLLTQIVGQNLMISIGVLVVVMAIAIIAGEKVLTKKNMRVAELNAMMQVNYVCPHCHKFFGLTPYRILKAKKYCPNCGVPLK